MNSRLLASGLLALTVSFMSIQARAMQFPDEIDITAAVREANAGKTKLDSGGCPSGYTVDNAFGIGEAKLDRVMLTNAYNRILWTISNDFEAGKPIVVTKYTIKRTSPASETADPYGYNRAPKTFFFQGSYNGSDWITLSEISTTWDKNTLEKPLRSIRSITVTTGSTAS